MPCGGSKVLQQRRTGGCGSPLQPPTPGSPWPRCPSGMAAVRTSTVSPTSCWMRTVTCPQPCELASPYSSPDSFSFPAGGSEVPRALDYFLNILLIGSMDQTLNLKPESSPGSVSNSCVTSGKSLPSLGLWYLLCKMNMTGLIQLPQTLFRKRNPLLRAHTTKQVKGGDQGPAVQDARSPAP